MNQLNDSNTIIVAGDNEEGSEVYYAIPVVMGSTDTDSNTTNTTTYTITSSESLHNGTPTTYITSNNVLNKNSNKSSCGEEVDNEYEEFTAEHSHITSENFITIPEAKGSIVKAEPLQICSDAGEQNNTQTMELYTM